MRLFAILNDYFIEIVLIRNSIEIKNTFNITKYFIAKFTNDFLCF